MLAPRLARSLAADAGRLLVQKEERYYRQALASLGTNAFDLAVENLVPFLYARRGHQDPLAADAARKLQDVTGCDLPAAWKRLEEAEAR
jgi:hypothetical protein